MSVEEALRIGELAAQLGLNPRTIRYYEDLGLLPEPRRTPAGYRLYGAADRERLAFIVKARAIGLTLEAIGEILALRRRGEGVCEHVLALLDGKIAGIDLQLRTLGDVRQELTALRKQAAKTLPAEGVVCGIIEHQALLRGGRPISAVAPVTGNRSLPKTLRRSRPAGSVAQGSESATTASDGQPPCA